MEHSIHSWEYSAVGLAVKRLIDVVGAAIALILFSLPMLVIALLIKFVSPGPVFFRQQRLGKSGVPFRIWKFRTMRVDAEEVLRADPALYQQYVASGFKLPEGRDPRITPLGRFLRNTSLDELPQFVNVLCGQMSLVGPRPIVSAELAQYGNRDEQFLSMKPGITGYWQVSGRSNVGYPERVDLELYYSEHWTLGLDLKILVLTIPAVLLRRGAH